MDSPDTPFPVQKSNLYTFWLLQKQAVLENKWYMSERAGYDVGLAAAQWDFDVRIRPGWISGMKERGLYPS